MKNGDRGLTINESAKKALDDHESSLSGEVLTKIGAARRQALSEAYWGKHKTFSWLAAGMGSLAIAGLAMFAVLSIAPVSHYDGIPASEDIELLASSEELEFYDQLEFYLWLEDETPSLEIRS